jgi:hypothetical protein
MSDSNLKKVKISFWPIIMIITGIFWLLGNLGYQWVENIWLPVIIIIIGIYLIYRNSDSNNKIS